jgi:arylsulfatase A-like enzyme
MGGMWRRRTLLLIAFVVLGGVMTYLLPGSVEQKPRDEVDSHRLLLSESDLRCFGCNLLLVSIDTLRADRLGSYGHFRPTSPHLDALAARSLVFRDVLAPASTTAPSHRSIFSGLHVFEHGNTLDGKPHMAEILAGAGYRTGAFVDGGQLEPRFGMDRGFGTYYTTRTDAVRRTREERGLRVLNQQVIDWLRQDAGQRFFAFVHTYDVHCPYHPPEPYRSMFVGEHRPGFDLDDKCGSKQFGLLAPSEKDLEYIRAVYDGGIRYTDEKLSEILRALTDLGLARDTVIVVTSDHGESLGEHGMVGHNYWYDEQLKVPLIIHLPSDQAAVIDDPAHLIDLLPTVLAILGVEPPPALPGVDLIRFASGGEPLGARTRLAEATRFKSVRTDARWNLVLEAGSAKALFDLRADPQEESNLLDQQPEVASRLLQAYERLQVGERVPPSYPPDLDEQTIRELKQLGYSP